MIIINIFVSLTNINKKCLFILMEVMNKEPKDKETKIEDVKSENISEITSENSNSNTCEYDDWHSDFSIS
jgi:hypothetical protein